MILRLFCSSWGDRTKSLACGLLLRYRWILLFHCEATLLYVACFSDLFPVSGCARPAQFVWNSILSIKSSIRSTSLLISYDPAWILDEAKGHELSVGVIRNNAPSDYGGVCWCLTSTGNLRICIALDAHTDKYTSRLGKPQKSRHELLSVKTQLQMLWA